jgi:hypothetical protein
MVKTAGRGLFLLLPARRFNMPVVVAAVQITLILIR